MIYSYIKANNPDKLIKELGASSLALSIKKIIVQGAAIEVETITDLSTDEQNTLLQLIQAHNPEMPDIELIVKYKIYRCMDFGKEIMAEFGAQNVALGMSDAQMKQISVEFGSVQGLLLSGSLRLAKQEIDAIQTSLVTESRRAYFSNKIANFLAGL